jgi:hypothetical protein
VFSRFVKPYVNRVLSEYILNLCSIEQKSVDDARDFMYVLHQFHKYLNGAKCYCNGADSDVFCENLKLMEDRNQLESLEIAIPNITSVRPDICRFLGISDSDCVSGTLLNYIDTNIIADVHSFFEGMHPHDPVYDSFSVSVILGLMNGASRFSLSNDFRFF